MRSAPFFTNGYYHIFNRGVDKRKIYLRYGHYLRFLRTIHSILDSGSATPHSLRNQSLALRSGVQEVQILCYCLMPNHYHFLIKQLQDDGITKFMHKLNTSYTKYFNLNQKRIGRLFEYTFKSKEIKSDELLLHVSRYIHLNPLIGNIAQTLEDWQWSSYLDYIGSRNGTLCDKDTILSFFSKEKPERGYRQFVEDQVAYARLLKETEEAKDEDAIFF